MMKLASKYEEKFAAEAKISIIENDFDVKGHVKEIKNLGKVSEAFAAGQGAKIVALNPQGYPPRIAPLRMAERLERLAGKTVYLVDCRFDDSDVFLKQMQAWFSENMPAVKTVFKPISSVYTKDDPATWEEIKANGDAAVVGVGH